MTDNTLEPTPETLSAGLRRFGQTKKKTNKTPSIVVLYHPDLTRIGAVLSSESLRSGQWVEIGRLDPLFTAPTPSIKGGPLDDPYISRRQLRVRWLDGWSRFEVEPLGRRPLSMIDMALDTSEPVYHRLTVPTRLEPGSVIAIGQRILLGLSWDPWHGPDEDRLGMIGESGAVWRLRSEILQVARFQKPALLLGPTGAGKELVARALHALSDRDKNIFLPINCAALPEHLTESLLFGHKKGAFTGADTNRDGAFLEARGGTLFMDEIGELPLQLQAKLLRVLQEGHIVPVGSNRPIPVDVRLMAATHRDLKHEMDTGNLRADFYYRIAVHPIHLPSLAERSWDVPLLFVHFLSRSRATLPELSWMWQGATEPTPPIPLAFFLKIMRHGWPGNVRELQNAVEQVSRYNLGGGPFATPPQLIATSSPTLTPNPPALTLDPDLSAASAPPPPPPSRPTFAPPAPVAQAQESTLNRAVQVKVANQLRIARKTFARLIPPTFEPQRADEPFDDFVQRAEDAILATLLGLFNEHVFNQVHVAQHMNISRTTLVRLMKRFGIPRSTDLDAATVAALKSGDADLTEVAEDYELAPQALKLFLNHA